MVVGFWVWRCHCRCCQQDQGWWLISDGGFLALALSGSGFLGLAFFFFPSFLVVLVVAVSFGCWL